MKPLLIFLSKKLLRLAIDKALEQALPRIYEKLDVKIPSMLFNGASPNYIKSEIEFVIGQVTGKPVTKNVLDIVTTLYDPIQNAVRTGKHPR